MTSCGNRFIEMVVISNKTLALASYLRALASYLRTLPRGLSQNGSENSFRYGENGAYKNMNRNVINGDKGEYRLSPAFTYDVIINP